MKTHVAKAFKVFEIYEDGTVTCDLDAPGCINERYAYEAGYMDAVQDAYAGLKATTVPEFYREYFKRLGWPESK